MSLNLDPSTWRITYPKHHPATPGGDFKVKLLEGYPRGSITKDDASVEEQFILEASELGRFITDAFPLVSIESDTLKLPKTRTRVLAGLGVFEADSLEFEPWEPGLPCDPFGDDDNAPTGTYGPFVKVSVRYGAPKGPNNEGEPGDEQNPITFLERSCTATGEYLHSYGPAQSWYQPGGAGAALEAENVNQVGVPVIITVPQIEWSLRWPILPSSLMENVILPNMYARLGSVNHTSMPIFFNAPAETILFAGWNINQAFNWRGGFIETPPVQLDMKFIMKCIPIPLDGLVPNFFPGVLAAGQNGSFAGHNHAWRAGVGWQRLVRNPAHPDLGVYQHTDLNNLFKGIRDLNLADEGYINPN